MQYLAGISQDANTLNNIVTVGSLRRLILDLEATGPFQDGDYSACALPDIVTD